MGTRIGWNSHGAGVFDAELSCGDSASEILMRRHNSGSAASRGPVRTRLMSKT